MTNVGALKGLYTAMGGQADDVAGVKTNAGMITALQSVAAGGGGGAGVWYVPFPIKSWSVTIASGSVAGYFDFEADTDLSETLGMADDYFVVLANQNGNATGYATLDSFTDDGEKVTGRIYITLTVPAAASTTITNNDFDVAPALVVFPASEE